MFDRPLLQDNIWNTFLNFNRFYLTSTAWAFWLVIVLSIMSLAIFFLRKSLVAATGYADAYDADVYIFDKKSKANRYGFVLLLFAIALTALRMFTLENSLFENFDLMALNTTRSLNFGLRPFFDFLRIAPLSYWYLSSLYAVTHNIYLIKIFVLMQLMIAVVLMYYLFNYLTVTKRLVLISLFLLSPTMLPTANIIFVEREIIIALAASLIFAKRYCRNQKLSDFFGFMFFMTISVYTKETCLLFFAGLVAASILYNIWCEKITLKSFLHPIKSIKTFPVEFLIVLNIFLYAVSYFLLIDIEESYASMNIFDSLFLISYYKFELITAAAAFLSLCSFSYKLHNQPINPLFRGSGFVCGGLFIAISIVFYLNLAPSSPHLYMKTYYLVLTLLFSLAYLFQKTNNRKILTVLSLLIGSYSIVQNIAFYKAEEGVFRRQVAEFLAQNMNKNEKNTIYLAGQRVERRNLTIFVFQAYSTAYRYYFKGYDIIFKTKTNCSVEEQSLLAKTLYFPMLPEKGLPQSGEWLILNKKADYPDIVESLADTVPDFENKLFKVYHIK